MDISIKNSPVYPNYQGAMSSAWQTRLLGKPSPAISADQNRIEQFRQNKAHTDLKIADSIDKFLTSMSVRLEFYLDDDTGNIILRIVQRQSGRIIREIPAMAIFSDAAPINETI